MVIWGYGQGTMAAKEALVLAVIGKHGIVGVKDIQAATGITKGYLGDILAHLLTVGDVQRVADGYRLRVVS